MTLAVTVESTVQKWTALICSPARVVASNATVAVGAEMSVSATCRLKSVLF